MLCEDFFPNLDPRHATGVIMPSVVDVFLAQITPENWEEDGQLVAFHLSGDQSYT
ncbi:hypothetical protein [Arthrobacter sp.]|uniref:hypothetical protein n=1 Tax=Arthrobacter sp. TaxID=1667 RepID=UPI003A92C487